MLLQAQLLQEFRRAVRADPLVGEAVMALMPWHPVDIGTLATHLALSASQLRRRCLHAVGVSPKVLQRTLRFQGFLALAQAGEVGQQQHLPLVVGQLVEPCADLRRVGVPPLERDCPDFS